MLVSQTLLGLSGLTSLVVAAPHVGMIDVPAHRDVGAVFEKPEFKGDSKFLLESKGQGECLPLTGIQIGSIQICTSATCILSTGVNCKNESEEDSVVKIMGPVDVEDPVKLLGHGQTEFKSYLCGKGAEGVVADRTIYPRPQEHHLELEVEAQV